MKKIIAMLTAGIIAVMIMAIPVNAADGWLMRGNHWGTTLDEIIVNEVLPGKSEYLGITNEHDSSGHEWLAASFKTELLGETYIVRYDMNHEMELVEITYLGEVQTDIEALRASFNRMHEKITAEYGEASAFDDYGGFCVAEWSSVSGNDIILILNEDRVKVFATPVGFDWDTMDHAAGAGITVEEIPLA
ncbi:MAG: hypothetical protein E7507_05820 [Ruminococcus sp.]|nr:hypothetical protein [Ruminococcus sp.]